MTNARPAVAFFDFDKTLLRKESGEVLALPALQRRLVPVFAALRFAAVGIGYKLGISGRRAIQSAGYGAYRGRPPGDIARAMRDLYPTHIEPVLAPGIVARLQAHQAQGHRTVILTASPGWVAVPAGEALGFDEIIGTEMAVDSQGLCTGLPDPPIVEGEHKAVLARQIAAQWGARLADCSAYTDSIWDLELLEAVGHPYAVAPDRKLAVIARERGWSTLSHDD